MLVRLDVDRVGGRIIGHTKVHQLAHIPEFHIVVAVNGVSLQLYLLAIRIEDLSAACAAVGPSARPTSNPVPSSSHSFFLLIYVASFG